LTAPGSGAYINIVKTHREIDRRSLALMTAVIEKIDEDPQKKGIDRARSVCARWLKTHDNPYLKQWNNILSGDWTEIKKVLLDDSEEATALRQCNPFCGILSPKERWAIYREYRNR